MEKDQHRRYATMLHLADDLSACWLVDRFCPSGKCRAKNGPVGKDALENAWRCRFCRGGSRPLTVVLMSGDAGLQEQYRLVRYGSSTNVRSSRASLFASG